MQVIRKPLVHCCLQAAFFCVTSAWGAESTLSSCILTNVCFPRGNVLVWTACLQRTFSEQHGEKPIRIAIDVGLPVFRNAMSNGHEEAIRYLCGSAMSNYVHSLQGETANHGIGMIQGPMDIPLITLGDALELFQACFDCHATVKDGCINVRLFPEELALKEYRLRRDSSLYQRYPNIFYRDLDMFVTAYGGECRNPAAGIVYGIPSNAVFYVLAPPDRHEKVSREGILPDDVGHSDSND